MPAYPSGVDRLFHWGELCQAERSGSGCFVSGHFDSGGRLADVNCRGEDALKTALAASEARAAAAEAKASDAEAQVAALTLMIEKLRRALYPGLFVSGLNLGWRT